MAAEGRDEASWSNEQRRLLDHERFQAEVLRLRGGQGGATQGKPRWQRFLESTGGAALITVLVGGLFGKWISDAFEKSRAENERSYLAHKEYLEQRLATINPALELIGNSVAAGEDLITLTRPDFDPNQFLGPEREATLANRREIRAAYNQADSVWRREKGRIGYLLAYYHPGVPGVTSAWGDLERAVTGFLDCARDWMVANAERFTEEAATACQESRAKVDEEVGSLIGVLQIPAAPS